MKKYFKVYIAFFLIIISIFFKLEEVNAEVDTDQKITSLTSIKYREIVLNSRNFKENLHLIYYHYIKDDDLNSNKKLSSFMIRLIRKNSKFLLYSLYRLEDIIRYKKGFSIDKINILIKKYFTEDELNKLNYDIYKIKNNIKKVKFLLKKPPWHKIIINKRKFQKYLKLFSEFHYEMSWISFFLNFKSHNVMFNNSPICYYSTIRVLTIQLASGIYLPEDRKLLAIHWILGYKQIKNNLKYTPKKIIKIVEKLNKYDILSKSGADNLIKKMPNYRNELKCR
jgi:hypothetical protein